MRRLTTALCILAGCLALNAQPAPGSFEQTWEKGLEWLQSAVIYQVYPS